jgi:hypothetical protein
MLWNFECYLKSCGFVFDGHLEVVPEFGYDLKDEVEEELPYCCMGDTDECCEEHEEYRAEKLKEWNKGLDKLEKEVKKNKWVHGICNPPSPDWKKSDSDNCWNS